MKLCVTLSPTTSTEDASDTEQRSSSKTPQLPQHDVAFLAIATGNASSAAQTPRSLIEAFIGRPSIGPKFQFNNTKRS
jgi:hypothetical protein